MDISFRKWECTTCGITFEAPVSVIPERCPQCGGTHFHLVAHNTYVDGRIDVGIKEKIKTTLKPFTNFWRNRDKNVDARIDKMEREYQKRLASEQRMRQETLYQEYEHEDIAPFWKPEDFVAKARSKEATGYFSDAAMFYREAAEAYRLINTPSRMALARRCDEAAERCELKVNERKTKYEMRAKDQIIGRVEGAQTFKNMVQERRGRIEEFDDLVRESQAENTRRRYSRLLNEAKERDLLADSEEGDKTFKKMVRDSIRNNTRAVGVKEFDDLLKKSRAEDAAIREARRSEALKAKSEEEKINQLLNNITNDLNELQSVISYSEFKDYNDETIRMLNKAKDYCVEALDGLNMGDYEQIRELFGRALDLYSNANKRKRYMMFNSGMTPDGEIGSAGNKYNDSINEVYAKINNLKDQLKGKNEELKSKDAEIPEVREKIEAERKDIIRRLNFFRDRQDFLQKSREKDQQTHSQVGDYVRNLINKGYSAESAKKRAAQVHKLNIDEINNALGDNAETHEERVKEEGHRSGGRRIPIISGMKDWGRNRNTKSIEGLMKRREELINRRNQFESNRENLSEGTHEYKKNTDELEQCDADIAEVDRELEMMEQHPDWLGRNIKKTKDFRDKLGSTMISKYSSFKEKGSSVIQSLLAIIIFGGLIWLTLTQGKSFMPIDIYQVFVFIVLTLILAGIKYSLSEDQDGAAEARELVLVLTVLFTLFAIYLGWDGPSPWSSLIFCLILGAYVFFLFYTDSVLFSFILFFIMAFLVYFTMAGWTNEIGILAEKTAQQTGFYEAIDTTFASINAGMSDVWMMLTDPTGWSEKKEMEQNAQKNEGETNRALEISKAEVRPSSPKTSSTVDVVVDVDNFGTQAADKPARNAKISLINDYKHMVSGNSLLIPGEKPGKDDEGNDVTLVTREHGNILSGTGAEEVFEVQIPVCVATFDMKAEVSYEYTVDATTNIFVVNGSRYDELTTQDKFVAEKQITKSSAGPVSIAMRTNFDQPIPVPRYKKNLRLHFGFINERSGSDENKINITNATITIPVEFEVLFTNPDVDGYKCEFCYITKDNKNGAGEYSLRELYLDVVDDKCGTLKSSGVEIPEGVYTCGIQPTAAVNSVYFQKPFNVRAKVDYGYKYKKSVSFSVRDDNLGEKKVQCTAS